MQQTDIYRNDIQVLGEDEDDELQHDLGCMGRERRCHDPGIGRRFRDRLIGTVTDSRTLSAAKNRIDKVGNVEKAGSNRTLDQE